LFLLSVKIFKRQGRHPVCLFTTQTVSCFAEGKHLPAGTPDPHHRDIENTPVPNIMIPLIGPNDEHKKGDIRKVYKMDFASLI
jgi:hypothetical protein